jgi:SAM-dependent methyltransferase
MTAFSAWRWPLPALVAWAGAWLGHAGLMALALDPIAAFLLSALLPALLATKVLGAWRRGIVIAGFPASALALGVSLHLPAWAWLLPLAALVLVYPLQAWRDAPIFPTPPGALRGLAAALDGLPTTPRLLDAGCGLGQGLAALRSEWPAARIEGLERSGLMAFFTRLRCPWARVQRADMWAVSWREQDLVYLFQRPESMARAWAKACAEMAPGGWLVSLEFVVPGVAPDRALTAGVPQGGKPVWAYRVSGPPPAAAPKSRLNQRGRAPIKA